MRFEESRQRLEERDRRMAPGLGRRLLAEAIGTRFHVVFGAGAALAALTIEKGNLDFPRQGVRSRS
jgi:hypothetical protein